MFTYHVTHVEDHDLYKDLLLHQIEVTKRTLNLKPNPAGNYYYDFEYSGETDNYHPAYFDTWRMILKEPMKELELLTGTKLKVCNKPWFQQYLGGGKFGWHEHNRHWACVYYADLEDPTDGTEFYYNGEVHQPYVKEGDIIFFPSYLIHRAPVTKGAKTIVSTNIEIEVDRKNIKK